ncbi:hypothetical protein QTP88_007861 [Uroleucon formosanum]
MQLRDILISLPGQLKLPFDVNAISLYELSKTSKLAIVYMNGTLVFELIIPLLNPVELTLYHMIPLPVRREKLYMHLTPEFEYMAISKTHEYYLTISVTHLMKCRELTSITMCPETQPLRIGSAGLPCEVELFMKPTVVPATCTVKYLEITRSIYHKLKYHNKWIYIINTLDDVAVTCDQSDNAKNIQLRGVGILTLSEQCRAHTPQVVLTPSRHLKSVQYLDFIPPVNIPNVKIPLVPSFKFDNLLNHQTSIIKLNHISDFSKTIEELENAVQDEKNRSILQTTSGALYSPPRHNISNATFTDYFNTIKNNFIIVGDYNAKHNAWGCRTNNPRGIVLYNFVNANNFNVLAPPGPTYWPSSPAKKPDILDIFETKIPSNLHCLTKNILELNSDHSSVILNVSATVFARVEPPRLFSPLTDRLEFQNIINQRIDLKIKLKSNYDIDEAVNNLTMLIQSAAWEATKPNKTHDSKNNYPIVSDQICCLIVEKRRARAKYQVTRLPSHKTADNKLANLLKKVLAKYKSYEFEQKLHSLSITFNSNFPQSNNTKNQLFFKQNNTYQTNEEKAFRVVIRHLHHTTPTDYIKEELHSLGFITRSITNCLQYKTKNPLPLFFVDLEPSPSNHNIYKVDSICYTKIKIEAPHPKKNPVQRLRLWTYQNLLPSHTPMCKCCDIHLSFECQKDSNTPATCALCSGDHPASYKDCPKFKLLQKGRSSIKTNRPTETQDSSSTSIKTNTIQENPTEPCVNPNTDSVTTQLTNFIVQFKSLINPLIALLTKLIDTLLVK